MEEEEIPIDIEPLASGSSPKVDAAERDVALAQARFSADLHSVSRAGQRLTKTVTKTIVKGARPALIGVAVMTGAALIVTVWRSRRRSRPFRIVNGPAPRSLFWELTRAAVVALASSAGRHLAQKLADSAQLQSAVGQLGTPEASGPRVD